MNNKHDSQSIHNKKTIDLFNRAFYLTNSQTLPKNTTTNYYSNYVSDNNYLSNFSFQAKRPSHYQKAIIILTSILDFDSQNIPSIYLRGICYLRIKKYDLAIDSFKNGININKFHANLYNGLGTVYLTTNDYLKAIKYYTKCLETDPKLKKVYYNRAVSHLKLSESSLAYSDFMEYNKYFPAYLDGIMYLTKVSIQLELFEDVLKYTSEFIKNSTSDADIYYSRGMAFFKLKQNKEALQNYEIASRLNPKKYLKEKELTKGRSFENPYQVQMVPDVYHIIKRDYPFYKTKSQKLVFHHDVKYDVLELTSHDREDVTLYFKYVDDIIADIMSGKIKEPKPEKNTDDTD